MEKFNEIKIDDDAVIAEYFSDDIFNVLIAKIRKYPLLSSEENKRLALLAQEGDKSAREKLINSNLRLVISVASHYRDRVCHMSFLDIFQEGVLGLIKSIDKFDPKKGAFSTCAVPWIRQAIGLAINNKEEEIRKSYNYHEKRREYLKIIEKCKKQNVPAPGDKELCKMLVISLELLKEIKNKIEIVSSNQTITEDGTTELQDTFESMEDNFDYVEKEHDNQLLFVALKNKILTPIQYYIIYHRYYSTEKKTLQEIASVVNVSYQRVQNIEDTALLKIEPYLLPESKMYGKVTAQIKNDGYSIKNYNIEPIEPENITLYLYLKKDLNLLEQLILYYNWFGILNIDYYLNELEINKEQYLKIIKLLNIKIKMAKSSTDFEDYRKMLNETNGSKIFELIEPDNLNKDFEVIRKLIQE